MRVGFVAILLATTLVYLRVRPNGFVYEDFQVRQMADAGHAIALGSTNRSLMTWSVWADQRLFGEAPFGWHLTNLALHLLNGFLVWVLARRLGMTAWLVAGLFLLHPLNSESVVYLNGRGDLLAVAGILGTLVCVVQIETDDRRGTAWWTVGGLICALLALASKQSAVAIVGLIPLVWWVAQGGVGVSVLFAGLSVLVAARAIPFVGTLYHVSKVSPARWASMQAIASWRMVGLWIWPRGLTVDHFYGHPSNFVLGGALIAWILLAGVIATGVPRRIKFAILFVWLALAPRLVVPVGYEAYVNEHQILLATVGFSMLLSFAVEWIADVL